MSFELELFRKMYFIRLFEEKAIELYTQNLIRGVIHPYIGEEGVAVGACAALQVDDYVVSTHRGHGHCIAKGGDLPRMMAELLGKKTGYCKGKGGSMHIAAFDINMLGATGVVGAGIPIAVGSGLSAILNKSKRVTICFFGDGATNQGTFHEGLNLAAIWKLPVVFMCENNLYAISTHISRVSAVDSISKRARSYNIPGVAVNGNDVLAVCKAAKRAVKRAREGNGPTLIEAKTYRFEGHYKGDAGTYRSKGEVEHWKNMDPIRAFKQKLISEHLIDKKKISEVEEECRNTVEDAVTFAKNSPTPDPEEAFRDIF